MPWGCPEALFRAAFAVAELLAEWLINMLIVRIHR